MKLNLKVFTVKEVIKEETIFLVSFQETDIKGVGYRHFLKDLSRGQKVLVNTTAVDMNLGTGGFHYIVANLDKPQVSHKNQGHIMKLKYTPLQFAAPVVEELEEYQEKETLYIDGIIIVTMLHSQIAPLVIFLKKFLSKMRVAVLQNDFCALPSSFSSLLKWLKKEGFIESVITFGNSFGGDKEAINIYSALVYAINVLSSEIVIVSPGPGMPGTSSRLGNGAIGTVEALNAAFAMGGEPVLTLRMSSKDPRKRHRGLSHHVETVLNLALSPSKLYMPIAEEFDKRISAVLKEERKKLDLFDRASVYEVDVSGFTEELRKYSDNLETMGRSIEEDLLFFAAASAPAYALKAKMNG